MDTAGKVREIRSPGNARFKALSQLLKASGIRKQGRALISGRRHAAEMARDFPGFCEAVLVSEADQASGIPVPAGTRAYRLASRLFRELDIHGTGSPLLVVRVPGMGPWAAEGSPSGCTLFVPFQDPYNVGAVIRAAAAFGVPLVVLLEEAAHPFHPRSARAAGSALFRVAMERGPALDRLQGPAEDFPMVALSQGGKVLAGYRFPPRFGLVAGMEGPGLPEDRSGWVRVGIPMEPGVESLNAAMAAGIALYSWRRQVESKAREAR